MSASDEWTEYHLTPSGWKEGSHKIDFSGVTHVPPPADRLVTCIYRELLTHGLGKMHKTVREEWRSPDDAAVVAALAKFGPCPEAV